MTLTVGLDTEEADFLAKYNAADYPPVAVTVDVAVLTIRDDDLCILLVERSNPPFKGYWSLPGRFVQPDERAEVTAIAGVNAKTNVVPQWMEQLGTYSAPDRDPRMRVISIAYLAFGPFKSEPKAGYHTSNVEWVPILKRPVGWAFDHGEIARDAIARLQSKMEYTPLATRFLPETFTIADLHRVYQTVWGYSEAPLLSNFHRKIQATRGFLTPTGEKRGAARLYRAGPAKLLFPPIRREGGDWS